MYIGRWNVQESTLTRTGAFYMSLWSLSNSYRILRPFPIKRLPGRYILVALRSTWQWHPNWVRSWLTEISRKFQGRVPQPLYVVAAVKRKYTLDGIENSHVTSIQRLVPSLLPPGLETPRSSTWDYLDSLYNNDRDIAFRPTRTEFQKSDFSFKSWTEAEFEGKEL